jgi:hypothetical protein
VTPGLRRLYAPRPAAVRDAADGVPRSVDAVAVEALRERWLVDDRWWVPQGLRREYFELVLADGRSVVVFRCLRRGRWFRQRA